MLRRLSIAELQRAGITIGPAEAVAIAQQLIRTTDSPGSGADPYGEPSPATVFLSGDGSVSRESRGAVTVAHIAALLEALLPEGTPHVPGSLRYTVARAQRNVDAPPFATLDELALALARHERGDRADVIRALLDRAGAPAIDRRRSDPVVTNLRRQLRESDARVYDQQLAIDAMAAMRPRRPASPRPVALAAGLLVGVTLVGAGEWMHLQHKQVTVVAAAPATGTGSPGGVAPSEAVSADPMPGGPGTLSTEKTAMRKTSRAAARGSDRAPERRSRFHWLRTKIMVRTDPL